MENEQNFFEKRGDRIFTKEEVLATIGRFTEGKEITREESDEHGLAVLEVTVEEGEGKTTEYQYTRKGRALGGGAIEGVTSVNVYSYEDGMPTGTEVVSTYNEETGEWEDVKKVTLEEEKEVLVVLGEKIKERVTVGFPERASGLELREAGPEIAEFETMMADFEKEHPLEALLAITDLTIEDAPNHPIREPAKIALVSIIAKFEVLKKETTITDEQLELLEAKRKKLSMAVGLIDIKTNKIDHTRM